MNRLEVCECLWPISLKSVDFIPLVILVQFLVAQYPVLSISMYHEATIGLFWDWPIKYCNRIKWHLKHGVILVHPHWPLPTVICLPYTCQHQHQSNMPACWCGLEELHGLDSPRSLPDRICGWSSLSAPHWSQAHKVTTETGRSDENTIHPSSLWQSFHRGLACNEEVE